LLAYAVSQLPLQTAIAFNLARAIQGNSPDSSLDYTKIRFSNGKLALPDHTAIEALPGCKVEFSWIDDGTDNYDKAPGDLTTFLVYNPVKANFTYRINANTRTEKFYVMQLPDAYIGDTVYCYLSFKAVKNRRLVSQSICVGKAIVH
jgi:hypothetical protein